MAKIDFEHNPIIQPLVKGGAITTADWIVENQAGNWDMKPDRDFGLSMDENRYKRCEEIAIDLKKQYPLTDDLPFEEDVRRERIIVTRLVDAMHAEENYWHYNKNDDDQESLHNDCNRANDSDPNNQPEAKEFKPGEFVCRHYSPMLASLCKKAGMELIDLNADVQFFSIMQEKLPAQIEPSTHQYSVSLRTLSVIEGTVSEGERAYKHMVNGLTIEEFIAGKTLVVANDSSVSAYGTGYYSQKQDALIAKRLNQIKSGTALLDLTYDDQRYSEKERDDALKQMSEYNTAITAAAYKDKVAPIIDEVQRHAKAGNWERVKSAAKKLPFTQATFGPFLDRAVASGDVNAIDAIMESAPIHKDKLGSLLVQAIKNNQFDAANVLVKKGVGITKANEGLLSEADMADLLGKSIRATQHIELAAFAIDHGALKGFKDIDESKFADEKLKARMIFWDSEKQPQDKAYTDQLMSKLQVSPEVALEYCKERKWEKNAQLVIDIVKDRRIAEQLKAQAYIEEASKDIKAALQSANDMFGSLNLMGLDKLALPFMPKTASKPQGIAPK